MPKILLDDITTFFDITHSYFSSPVTGSTLIKDFHSPFSREKIFGSIGYAFFCKWKGIGYVHPHNKEKAEKAIHWARLVAKNDPNTMTILSIPDNKWYQNHTPHIGPFPNTHVIAHIPANMITYDESIIPLDLNKPQIEPSTIHILCVHHNNNNVGNIEQITALNTIFNILQILLVHTQIAPLTPPNIPVNKSKKWNTITYPITNLHQNNETPSLPHYETNNSSPNTAIIQTVPSCHHNKLMIVGHEKKQDTVYTINPKT